MEELKSLVVEFSRSPFVQAILVVAVVNVVVLVGVLLYALIQRLIAYKLERNLRRSLDIDAPVEELERELLRGVPRWSWAAAYVRHLVEARRRGDAQCNLSPLSDHIANRAHLPLSLVRQTAGVLVLLGLCGAVYGLFTVFQDIIPPLKEIQRSFDADTMPATKGYSMKDDPAMKSFKSLAVTLEGSLTSTRIAFGASITGIVSTVVLILFGWLVGLVLDIVLLGMERVANERLSPLLILPSQNASMADAMRSFADSTGYLSTLSDSLTDQSTRVSEYMSSMYAFLEQFQDAARSLGSGHERLESSQKSLVGLVERFVGVSEEMQNGQSHNQRTIDELGGLMKATHERLDRQAESEARQRTRADEGLQKNMNLVRDLFEQNFVRLGEKVGETIQMQLAEHRKLLDDMHERQSIYFDTLNDAVGRAKGHKQLVEGVRGIVEQQRVAFDEQLGRFVAAQQAWVEGALTEGRRMQSSTLDTFRTMLERQATAMDEQVRALRTTREDELQRASTERAQLAEQIGRLGAAIAGRGSQPEMAPRGLPMAQIMGMAAILVPTVTLTCITYIGKEFGVDALPMWGGGLLACIVTTGGVMHFRGWMR